MIARHVLEPRKGSAVVVVAAAFTLIEVIVAMVVSIIILGVCTTIMVNTIVEGRRSRVQSEMGRDGAHTAQLLGQELRQAGLGVPGGLHINPVYGSANLPFYASILVAGTSEIGIVGDLPRPDATYSAYGPIHNRNLSLPLLPTGNHIAWHTENNGSCVVDGAAGACSTAVSSLFFPGEAGCDDDGDFGDRTCAWGLRRVVPNERLVIVSGDGRWTHAGMGNAMELSGPGLVLAAKLSAAYAPTNWPDPIAPALPVEGPNEAAGQGWVTTLDRVFFKYDSATRTIQRAQCTGDPDPENADWPGPTATTIPSLAALEITPPNGGVKNVCSAFEVIARHVESLTFTYFDNAGAVVATRDTGPLKRSIRRIAYRIQFRQTLDGRDVIYDVAGSVRLQNL
jgi:hypothetical protein